MKDPKPYQEGDHIRDFIDFALGSADDAGPRGDDAKDALAELERLLWFAQNVKGASPADAQALADLRTLDEWAQAGDKAKGYRSHVLLPGTPLHDTPGASRVVLRVYTGHHWRAVHTEHGPTPDAARHAAAEWVRGQVKP